MEEDTMEAKWTKELIERAEEIRGTISDLRAASKIHEAERDSNPTGSKERNKAMAGLRKNQDEIARLNEVLQGCPPSPIFFAAAIEELRKVIVGELKQYETIKAGFLADAEKNPASAIEWATTVVKAQTVATWLAKFLKALDGATGIAAVKVAWDRLVESGEQELYYHASNVHNSTSPFSNAVRMAETEALAVCFGEGGYGTLRELSHELKWLGARVDVWEVMNS